MIKAETTIPILENNDPLLRLKFWVIDESVVPATKTPYNLTGVDSIQFFIKPGLSTPDDEATKVYTLLDGDITIEGLATDGEVTVQVMAADIAVLGTGTFRYRADVVRGGLRDTVMAGPFVIRNT